MSATLLIRPFFHKVYVCDSCGTECYFCVTHDKTVRKWPRKCPFRAANKHLGPPPKWRPIEEARCATYARGEVGRDEA